MGVPSQLVPEIVHYKNGGLKMTGSRLDGELHGLWAWYRTDGSIMRTGQFHRGRQVGVWATHDRAGGIVKETDFDK